MPEQIKIEDIVLLPEIQIRVRISAKVVDEYAAAMKDGAKFDPIDLFRDAEDRLLLADGAHRYLAAQQRSLNTIDAEIHKCDPVEAVSRALELSLERNCRHGLRLSSQDKRNAVKKALEDKLIRRRGDRAIAKLCGVSPALVSDVRKGSEEDQRGTRRPKHKAPEIEASEIVENSDPVSDRVRTLKEWLQLGNIAWPDVASVFTNDTHVAFLIPRKGVAIRMVGGKVAKEFEAQSITQMRKGDKTTLEIDIRKAEGSAAEA